MPQAERRGRLRVGFDTRIILAAGDAEIQTEGHSRDLSISGIYVKTHEKIAVNTPCTVKVLLSGTAEPLALKMDGRIVRTDGSGVGIAFESMDLDSYAHLKNIVRYNSAAPHERLQAGGSMEDRMSTFPPQEKNTGKEIEWTQNW